MTEKKPVKVERRDIKTDKIKANYNEPISSIYVDGVNGGAFVNNTVRLNLYEDKFNAEAQEVTRHIVTRLIMSKDAFRSLSEAM